MMIYTEMAKVALSEDDGGGAIARQKEVDALNRRDLVQYQRAHDEAMKLPYYDLPGKRRSPLLSARRLDAANKMSAAQKSYFNRNLSKNNPFAYRGKNPPLDIESRYHNDLYRAGIKKARKKRSNDGVRYNPITDLEYMVKTFSDYDDPAMMDSTYYIKLPQDQWNKSKQSMNRKRINNIEYYRDRYRRETGNKL